MTYSNKKKENINSLKKNSLLRLLLQVILGWLEPPTFCTTVDVQVDGNIENSIKLAVALCFHWSWQKLQAAFDAHWWGQQTQQLLFIVAFIQY